MSSWGVSACYPRRTFNPLREDPSTWNLRITKTDFRLCSTCMSHSQANFYFYALRCMSDASEFTFIQLWYSFRVRRPSETTHHAWSPFTERVRKRRVRGWYLTVENSHLYSTRTSSFQYKAIVKVHGVLPSTCEYSASSRRIQFH